MADQPRQGTQSSAGPDSPLAPYDFDLSPVIESLRADPAWQGGAAWRRLVHYPNFQIIVRALRAGRRIDTHQNPGRICVQTIAGHIRMHAHDRMFDLPVGRLLVLDREVPHDVEAVDDSVFLLTVAAPEGASPSPR
jgi:quercetin dioxygenase-like cupin family protein